jgi:4a-hydroxytetrahydrobiopterin dehydratase
MWKETKRNLSRSYDFRNFIEAFAFVNTVGMIASKNQHFPKICIQKSKVDIVLSTDGIGGFVTQKDHVLADDIDKMYDKSEAIKQSA